MFPAAPVPAAPTVLRTCPAWQPGGWGGSVQTGVPGAFDPRAEGLCRGQEWDKEGKDVSSVLCHCIRHPEPGREMPFCRQGSVEVEGAREAAAQDDSSGSSVQSPQPLPYLLWDGEPPVLQGDTSEQARGSSIWLTSHLAHELSHAAEQAARCQERFLPPTGRGLSSAKLWLAVAMSTQLHVWLQLPPPLPVQPGIASCCTHCLLSGHTPLLPGHRSVPDPIAPCTDSHTWAHVGEAHEGGGTCSPWTCTHHDHGSLPTNTGHLGVQGYGFVKYGPYKSHRVRAIILNIFSNIVQLFFPYIMGKLHWRVAALSRERVAGRH